LRELALKRNRKEKKFGACTYGGKQGSSMAHFIGLVGEYAVAKSVGTQVDERIFEDHGDDGIDIEDGKWGVKTTTYIHDPYLRVEVHHFSEDIYGYILCAYKPNVNIRKLNVVGRKVNIVGWASREEVRSANKRVLRSGGPLNYILKDHQLKDWITAQIESK
jgi:hypothetical protein